MFRRLILKQSNFLIFIFFLAFILRLAYAFSERIRPFADAAHYHRFAISISSGKGYFEKEEKTAGEYGEALNWPPFYPFFLALAYKIMGHKYTAVWIIQALLGALSCVWVYFLAKAIFNQRVAVFSAFIAAVYFDLIIYSAMLLTETLYIFLILVFFLLFLKKRYVAAGVLAGLSALTRPIIMIFYLFLFFWEWRREKTAKVCWFLLLLLLTIMPWIARNYFVYHRLLPITAGWDNLWSGNNPRANGENILPRENDIPNPEGTYLSFNDHALKEAVAFILGHPGRVFLLVLRKLSIFFSLVRINAWWLYTNSSGISGIILSAALSFLLSSCIFLLGIAGVVFSWRQNSRGKSLLRYFILLCLLSLIPFYFNVRFRLPVYPFLIIFMGYLLSVLPELKRKWVAREKTTLRYFNISLFLILLVIFNSVYDGLLQWKVFYEKLSTIGLFKK